MLQLQYPLKTEIHINQPFGANPDYYAKFGCKGHMGIDFQAAHGTPVYSPCKGTAFYVSDTHGGHGVYVHAYDTETEKYYNFIHWHLIGQDGPEPPPIPVTGFYPVEQGTLIGYADNSGAPYESSGDHLHFGVQPCNANYTALDSGNGYAGCIDPAPFLPPPKPEAANEAEQAIVNSTSILQKIAQATEPVSIKTEFLNELKVVIQKIESLL
jgi:murein DD-endopeptidase MepM/ murein hydrolase activator NlpD